MKRGIGMGGKTGNKPGKKAEATAPPPLYYRLHALLETIRAIKGFEDPLCTLLHTIQTAGTASPEVVQELEDVLDAMPSDAYAQELVGVRDVLEAKGMPAANPLPSANPGTRPSRPRTARAS